MADFDSLRHLSHLLVVERSADERFERRGGGNAKIREVEHRAHGLQIRGELESVFVNADESRNIVDQAELRALGTIITLEGTDASFPLRLDSLQQLTRHRLTPKRPKWLLLSVLPADDSNPERAMVWVADEYRAAFLQLFTDYLERTSQRADESNWQLEDGNPLNRELVANISRIRTAVLHDLWQSEGEPPVTGSRWWEIWLDTIEPAGASSMKEFAEVRGLSFLDRTLTIGDRTVAWVRATWGQLESLPFTRVPIAEIRRPEFVDTAQDLSTVEQTEYVRDLAERVLPPRDAQVALCHLDSGVRQSHVLLSPALAATDLHSILGGDGLDVRGHGTAMAGLALYGPLDDLLVSTGSIQLSHVLESVRMMPALGEPGIPPIDFGSATAEATALPEATVVRRRVFCLPLSAKPDKPGQPTLWSATVDALAVGTTVARDGEDISLIGTPEDDAKRLIVVAAGNVDSYDDDHLARSDVSPIEDPGQAWNALTVGAHTDLDSLPSHPDYATWNALASAGDLSPHSRTSVLFGRTPWPIKPDICMEGGNVLSDGMGFEDKHPLLSLQSTSWAGDTAIAATNATSAATAQASRLSALVMRSYPEYWPETVRGLIVHSAEWTDSMRAHIDGAPNKRARQVLLRRYGWGTPTEAAVLRSSLQAVTLVSQDEFTPFEGTEYRMRSFRLHQLPWPADVLQEVGAGDVTMKVTLSYFVEPSASRRGWRQRYTYASHALRFELQDRNETVQTFVARVNRDAGNDEDTGGTSGTSGTDRWVVGPSQRNLGTLHQDLWEGSGADLAACNNIAVYPVGGWWKRNRRKDRLDLSVRYSLVVSLKTAEDGVDLYTPIAVQLGVPVAATAS